MSDLSPVGLVATLGILFVLVVAAVNVIGNIFA
ncbi:MAG: hypothetical protein QOG15_2641 [Solirubrobacteraceae bacterium]|jgi:hypothetical protein|nr:hypothetical protein [Solirubrobacteraceae bacterium]